MILIVRTSVPVCALSVKKFETLFLCDVYIYLKRKTVSMRMFRCEHIHYHADKILKIKFSLHSVVWSFWEEGVIHIYLYPLYRLLPVLLFCERWSCCTHGSAAVSYLIPSVL